MRLESVYTQHHPNFGEGRVYADHGYVHYGVDSRRSRIFIHNIQVDAAHRGQGIGTALLDAVANQYPDHDMDLGYTTDDGEALWQSWLRKRATVEDALVHPHGDLERHMREDHGYADDEFGPIGYYRDKGPAAMAAWHESEHREQKRVENQGSRFRPGVMTPHTHNPGIQSVNQKTAVINEDGEYSEPLEPHERRYDPEVHKFEDNREFDTSKRMTSIPKHLCNSCGVEAKYVRGLCHDCWHNHGASFEAQPTGMWETDSGDTQERLRDALHPKGLDEYGRGWVNYTPDRGVKHSENSVQREQLHEIAKPKHVDTWGKSDEEKGQARQQSEHDYNDFWSRVKRAAGISDDEPAHTLHHVWQTGMQRAMANGTISVDQAEERGYHGDAREHGEKTHDWENNRDVRRGGYQPLPQHTFHTTTNLSAVQSEGLKTPEELAHKGGHGLGGGAGNTISVTTDHSLAHDIYHSLHERHAFLNGKIGWDDLIDNHHGGADPQKIRDSIDSSHTPSQVDRYKRGVVSGVGDNAPGLSTKEEAAKTHPEWSVSPNYPKDCAIETGKGTMYPSHAWERPATPEEHMEHRESYYKSFSWMRGTHGGHRDPLFMSTNPHEFAKKDPNEFAVTTITHNGNAHAFPLRQDGAHHNNADSGEWRTHSGENLRLSSWERPVPRHEIEQGLHKEGVAIPSRLERAWGSHDLDTLFPRDEDGPALAAHSPWPRKNGTETQPVPWDSDHIRHAMAHPDGYEDEVDPRTLHATQGGISRAGVSYYMGDEYGRTGRTFADQHSAANQRPIVYTHASGDSVIVTGHHRAAKSLLKGEPLQCLHVKEGQYAGRDGDTDSVRGQAPEVDRNEGRDDAAAGGGDHRVGRHRRATTGGVGDGSRRARTAGGGADVGPEPAYASTGVAHPSLGRCLTHHHAGSDLWRPPDPSIQPVRHVIEGARAYNQTHGLDDPHGESFHHITTNPQAIQRVGEAYDRLPMHDRNAEGSFHALRHEINRQYDHLTGTMGVKVHQVDSDPYSDVQAMTNDVHHNKTLKVLRTATTGGHPFLSDDENDKFRAVHDAFGHAATGRGFDRHGEEAAWTAHSKMFSHEALPAMTSETKGQNASLIKNGTFAPQKVALLPKELWTPASQHLAAHFGATDFIPGQGQLFDDDHSDHLPNPVEGGHDWHHGTPKDLLSLKQEHPEPDDDDGDYEEESRRHWNSYLGDHWTSMRGVGEMFARGGYHHSNDSDKGEGNVFTANLGIKNPKVYGAEARMDSEAVRHAWDQADPHDPSGVHAEHCNHDQCYDYQQHFEDHGDDRAGKRVRGHYEDPAFAADWLNSHPEKWNIADHFKRHLQSQGHDGVVYGNQVEGPSNHPCAITFNHDQVHNLRRSGMTGAPDHGGLFSRPHKPMEWIGEMHDRMGEPYDRHQRAFEEMRNKTASTDDDYHIDHRPADADGAPAHDLTKVYPDDVYSHSHYYGTGDDEHDAQSWSQVHRVKGRPDAKVRIYRSMPAEHVHKGIQPGDWVTTSKSYARQHGTHATDKNQDWPVIRAHVRADEIHTNGDSINEWGYNGDRPRQGMISYKGGHDQEVSHRADGTIRPVQRRQAAYTPKDIKVKLHHPRVGEYEQHRQVPRDEDGNPPERAYRWAHHEQVKGYQADGVPKGTYFSTEPDDRYRASDHALVSVPYSDEHFRSSMNLSGEHYLSTEATIPAEHVTVHHDKTAARVYRGERPDTGQRIYGDLSGRFFTPHVDMAKKYVGSGHLYYVDLPEDKEHWSWAAERPLPKEMAEAKVHDDENCPNCQLPHGLAARWLPQERVFGPTKETLDPRLFDGETLKPEVRHTILSMLDGCLSSHGLPDWQHWMRVFLAGSESTLWWGNNDFDTLLGCDYLALRRAHPEFAAMSIQGISDEFNTWFRAELNNEDWQAPWDVAEELWHITFYLNPMSWDIRQIKPYGAYSITDDTWVVRPPVLPEHKPEDFDASVYRLAESYADRIRRIIAAPPSPRRRGEADALWQFLHSDRGRAFGPRGHGYSDPGNLVWKYLDMHPDGLLTGLLEAREA